MLTKTNTSLYITFIIVCLSFTYMARDDDSDAINVRTFEDMQDSRPEEIQENCELDEMRAYSLIGDATSLSETNELCPSVSENCCGERDQENIVDLWREDSARIQKYTAYTLKILRYFLGNGENYYSIANSIIEDFKRKDGGNHDPIHMQINNGEEYGDDESDGYILNTNQYCFNAAEDVVTTNLFHKSTIEPFYHELNQKAEFLHNVRASFYCICLLYTSPSPRDATLSRMPSSA